MPFGKNATPLRPKYLGTKLCVVTKWSYAFFVCGSILGHTFFSFEGETMKKGIKFDIDDYWDNPDRK